MQNPTPCPYNAAVAPIEEDSGQFWPPKALNLAGFCRGKRDEAFGSNLGGWGGRTVTESVREHRLVLCTVRRGEFRVLGRKCSRLQIETSQKGKFLKIPILLISLSPCTPHFSRNDVQFYEILTTCSFPKILYF